MTTSLGGVNLKVMVIDDSSTIRRSAEIFCDILMPRLDGYQTCALIKKSAKFHATPVVMLSSKDGLFDRARGAMVGSDEYLTKPFTKDSLLKAVRQHTQTADGAIPVTA